MRKAAKPSPQSPVDSGFSFAWRLLVPFAVAVVLAALGATALATLSMREEANSQLEARARAIATFSADRLSPEGYRGALERGASVEGATVQLVAAPSAATVVRTAGSSRSFTFPLGRPARTGLAIRVTLSTSAIDAAAWRAGMLALALASAIAVLLGLGLHRLLRREIARPLALLQSAVERIRAGTLGVRVAVRGPAPLRRLGRGLERLAVAMAELDAQAATDPLTGVGNRRFFHGALATELQRATREETPLALVLLDLDGFKAINDTHGHPFGDGTLQRLATRLRGCLRATDVLARVGGDEFAIVLPGLDSEAALSIVARARAQAGEPVGGVEISWCAGIASYPHDARDAATLTECADVALYCAKSEEGSADCIYAPDEADSSQRTSDRAAITALLELANPIVPVFQPVVSLATGEVAGYEALARFPHPPARRPDEWFALARGCGLGPALEARAAREALAPRVRPTGTYLAFNVSASALASDELVDMLPQDLSGVVIELTGDPGDVDEAPIEVQLSLLRSRGARLAIDAAASDYSGLQRMTRLAPDMIKLDRTLVAGVDKDPVKAALIDSHARFAHRTGVAVCAEGVETPEELRTLTELEVDYAQGFGVGRPGPPWVTVSAWVSAAPRHLGYGRGLAAGEAV